MPVTHTRRQLFQSAFGLLALSNEPEPPPMHLCQVAFSVRNLSHTYRWYESLLGFHPSGGTSFPGFFASRIQGLDDVDSRTQWLMDRQAFRQLEMFEFQRPISRRMRPDQKPNDIGYALLGMFVEDFEYLLKRLRWAGIELTGPIIGPRGSRRLCIRDPEGVYLELFERDPFPPADPDAYRAPVAIRAVTLSVPKLSKSARFFHETLHVDRANVVLHEQEHEALWGLGGATSESMVLDAGGFLIELKQYTRPVGRGWPDGYRISDQGLQNVAFGFRERRPFKSTYQRVLQAGYESNSRPLPSLGWSVVYVNDDQGFSVELLHVRKWKDSDLGFRPRPRKRIPPTAR